MRNDAKLVKIFMVLLALTADCLGLLVYGGYLWIHLYEHLPLLHDLGVSFIYSGFDPCAERLPNNRVDDVGDVGPGQLQNLLLCFGQGSQDLIIVLAELEEVLDAKALILGHRDVLHVLSLNEQSFSCSDVSKMPDRAGVEAREVAADFVAEKVIHLLLVAELGAKVFGCDLCLYCCKWVNLVFLRHIDIVVGLGMILEIIIIPSSGFKELNPVLIGFW